MFKKLVFAFGFILAAMWMSESASADHCRGYSGYGNYHAPSVRSYAVPAYRSQHHSYHSGYHGYGGYHRSHYRSHYGYGGYGYGYGHGHSGYYGRGTSIGIGRGGISLNFGF